MVVFRHLAMQFPRTATGRAVCRGKVCSSRYPGSRDGRKRIPWKMRWVWSRHVHNTCAHCICAHDWKYFFNYWRRAYVCLPATLIMVHNWTVPSHMRGFLTYRITFNTRHYISVHDFCFFKLFLMERVNKKISTTSLTIQFSLFPVEVPEKSVRIVHICCTYIWHPRVATALQPPSNRNGWSMSL